VSVPKGVQRIGQDSSMLIRHVKQHGGLPPVGVRLEALPAVMQRGAACVTQYQAGAAGGTRSTLKQQPLATQLQERALQCKGMRVLSHATRGSFSILQSICVTACQLIS